MILTGRDIQWYIQSRKLTIDQVEPEQFQQNGVDLILDDVENHPEWFEGFHLAGTRERLVIPDDLMAFVELRSTWARLGLLLPPTVVDAGFRGNLTLEIFAAKRVLVPYGERFAHLIFAKLTGPSTPYSGIYLDQSGVTPARLAK